MIATALVFWLLAGMAVLAVVVRAVWPLRRKAINATHHPDYALIRSLEHELDLVPPGGHETCSQCYNRSIAWGEMSMNVRTGTRGDGTISPIRLPPKYQPSPGLVWPEEKAVVQFNPNTGQWERET